jgi:hypothetical protein
MELGPWQWAVVIWAFLAIVLFFAFWAKTGRPRPGTRRAHHARPGSPAGPRARTQVAAHPDHRAGTQTSTSGSLRTCASPPQSPSRDARPNGSSPDSEVKHR